MYQYYFGGMNIEESMVTYGYDIDSDPTDLYWEQLPGWSTMNSNQNSFTLNIEQVFSQNSIDYVATTDNEIGRRLYFHTHFYP